MQHPLLAARLLASWPTVLVVTGCGRSGSGQVSLAALVGPAWKSRDGAYALTLAVSASGFAFSDRAGSRRLPYRQLAKQLVLLGADTMWLYVRAGKVLRISPTSRRTTKAESIDLQYGTDFFRQEQVMVPGD